MLRNEKTELCYRGQVRKALTALLEVMNPQDQIEWGKLTYPELVKYARDFIETEIEELGPQVLKCRWCSKELEAKSMFWKAQHGAFCDLLHYEAWRKEQSEEFKHPPAALSL